MKSKWEVIADMQEMLRNLRDLMVKDDIKILNCDSKDSLEECIRKVGTPQELSQDLANAVRGWMLDNVEILYCKKESPVGWIAMDDVKRMLE